MDSRRKRLWVLILLLGVNTVNFYDRLVLSAVAEPIRKEWGLTDISLGWLQTAFTLLYAVVGIPLGRMADIWNRKRILTAGLILWSLLTYVSGLCRSFWSLFALRLGVGIGEAACAPAAGSLIGDLFAPRERGRAMSVFMAGLPLGIAMSFIFSGMIAQHFGWRSAFFVAGVPGIALAVLSIFMREPARGTVEVAPIGNKRRKGSPYLLVLSIPTMWCIIASGALHNFAMYALSSFLPAFLVRYHNATIQEAGFIAGIIVGSLGAAGMLLGGAFGDRVFQHHLNGRMLVAFGSILFSIPFGFLALAQPTGSLGKFMAFQGIAYMLLYVYYGVVYSSIHDIVEPSLRGTAMAVYFFAMYVLGASVGPVGTGWISDLMAARAARQAGVSLSGMVVPEQFRAIGLHQAMYGIPLIGIVLAAVLLAGSFTVGKDIARLREWMAATTIRGRTDSQV